MEGMWEGFLSEVVQGAEGLVTGIAWLRFLQAQDLMQQQ